MRKDATQLIGGAPGLWLAVEAADAATLATSASTVRLEPWRHPREVALAEPAALVLARFARSPAPGLAHAAPVVLEEMAAIEGPRPAPPGRALVRVEFRGPASAEREFNRWYDQRHLHEVTAAPGFGGAVRLRAREGRAQRYWALYELAEPDDFFRLRDAREAAGSAMWDGLWGGYVSRLELLFFRADQYDDDY